MSKMSFNVRDVPSAAGPLAGMLQDMRKALQGLTRESVSREELLLAGIVTTEDGVLVPPTPGGGSLPPPPEPINVSITVGMGVIFVEWEGITYPGHAYTEVMRAAADDFALAEVIGQTQGTIYVDTVGVGSPPYFYWLRFVNIAGVKGPVDTQAGHQGHTNQSIPVLLDALTAAAEDPAAPYSKIAWRANLFYVAAEGSSAPMFSVVTTPITNNGVTVPVGVYMAAAFIKNGDIVNAKIGNLAVDDAKVASISVGKMLAGSIGVGQYIQSQTYVSGASGWRIHADGTAELNNVIVRGTIYATAGSIGGIQIHGPFIQSSNYNGAGAGWRITSDGWMDLPNGSITSAKVAANSITGDRLTAGSVTADKMSVGVLSAISANLGYVSAGQIDINSDSGGGGWGYVRSSGKWRDDNWGWILAKHPSGSTFVDFNLNGAGLVMHHEAGAFASFRMWGPGFNLDNGGLTISQQNVIGTLQISGEAVTVARWGQGSGGAFTEFVVPDNQYWEAVHTATWGPGDERGSSYMGNYSLSGVGSIDVESLGKTVSFGDTSITTFRTPPVSRGSVTGHGAGYHRINAGGVGHCVLTTMIRKR